LLLQLDPLLVQFSDGLVERALVLAQTLRGRHALAESPFQDLAIANVSNRGLSDKRLIAALVLTFMVAVSVPRGEMRSKKFEVG
jgi:hypothetical protein